MRRMLLVLAVLGATLAVAAGCGDSDETTGTSDSLTKAEFVKQADAICSKHNKEIESKVQAFAEESGDLEGKDPTKADAKKLLEEVAVSVLKSQTEELRELPAPEGDEEQVELIIERQEESIEKVEEDPFFRTSGDPYEELNQPAIDYGLLACAQ